MIKISRQSSHRDMIRSYKIIIDEIIIGEIKDGEAKELDILPGEHTIYLKIDWCRSNKLNITVQENSCLELECGNSMNGLKILLSILYITIFMNKYLWIKSK